MFSLFCCLLLLRRVWLLLLATAGHWSKHQCFVKLLLIFFEYFLQMRQILAALLKLLEYWLHLFDILLVILTCHDVELVSVLSGVDFQEFI